MLNSIFVKLIVCLVFVDGIFFYGCGFGVIGFIIVELCFNMVMMGY